MHRRIIHVITDLNVGGAEMMFTRLVTAEPGLADESWVVSLLSGGSLASELRAAGIPVIELDFYRPLKVVAGTWRLARLIASTKPDIVQGWMYHGDLAALLALVLSGKRRTTHLVWNVRCSNLDLSRYGRLLRLVVRACVALSHFPDLIIANSASGMAVHKAMGYRPRRALVLPNGIDIDRYKPDPAARAAVRTELGIPFDAVVLAHVARVDPMKDQACLLGALAALPHLRALMIGAGTEFLRAPPNVHLLGLRSDVARLLAAADFVVSSSAFGEGFSNAVAEGMASGLPPIATNVGDSAAIVGDAGLIVPPRDPLALAAAIRTLADEPIEKRRERGQRARARIVENFSFPQARQNFARTLATLRER